MTHTLSASMSFLSRFQDNSGRLASGAGSSKDLAQADHHQDLSRQHRESIYIDLTDDQDDDEDLSTAVPGMLPIDEDNDYDDEEYNNRAGLNDFEASSRLRHPTKDAETNDGDGDGDEDPRDALEDALAGIGLVPLQTWLADWDGVMTSRAKAQAEKELAQKAAVDPAEGTTGKKSKKRKKRNSDAPTALEGGSKGLTTSDPSNTSSRTEAYPSRIEADDPDTSAEPARKKSRVAKKATFTVDADIPPVQTVHELAQWLEIDKPEFTFKFRPADRDLGTRDTYEGRCLFNGQLFTSKSPHPKKASAKDAVALKVLKSFKIMQDSDDDNDDDDDDDDEEYDYDEDYSY
ncbi:hypothetical protein CF319_g4052 [Tilletia indica]|nr:hypothetical protein CF319_g4052 [Tilletia indica]